MRISDWSSDVCSSDLAPPAYHARLWQTSVRSGAGRVELDAARARPDRKPCRPQPPPRPATLATARARAGRVRLHGRRAAGAAALCGVALEAVLERDLAVAQLRHRALDRKSDV